MKKRFISIVIVLAMALNSNIAMAATAFAESGVKTAEAEQDIDGKETDNVYNGHSYALFNANALSNIDNWDDAEEYCESIGGHLAVISSQEENDFLYNYMVNEGCSSAYFGYTDQENEGEWKWCTDEISDYENWATGEPNQASSSEDYAMFYWKFQDGTWNDGDFAYGTQAGGRYFVCEWETTEADNSDYYTSTSGVCATSSIEALLGSSDYSSYFGSMRSIDMIIPGLKQTNMGNKSVCKNMVPQGVCATNDYVLISAYCKDKKHNSVIYVMDKNTKRYITTILLSVEDDAGLKNGNHVGGLTFGNNTVYIAGSGDKKVWKLPYGTVTNAVSSGKDAYSATISKDQYISTINASFIYWDESYQELFVGNFDESITNKNYMYSYNVKTGKASSRKIYLPKQTQGVSFGVGANNKTYCICSKSWGRKNQSEIYVAELKKVKDSFTYSLFDWCKITTPNMSEDIQVWNGTMYNCFESASNNYNSGGEEEQPFDRIPYIGVRTLISNVLKGVINLKMQKKAAEDRLSVSEDEIADTSGIILEGTCGENVNYCFYDDGELVVSGQGSMEDYSEDTTPWSDYEDEITSVYVDRGVTGIGEYAFYDCPNLTKVTLSEYMNTDTEFSIGYHAFGNCATLEEVTLPDVSVDIASNAFDESASIQFNSDSSDIEEYTKNNENMVLHQHDLEYVETVEATCLESGYDLYQCACGYEEVANIVEATDEHSYKEVERSEATETEDGFIKYQCENCIDTYVETLEYGQSSDISNATAAPAATKAPSTSTTTDVYVWAGEISGWGGADSYPSSKSHKQDDGEDSFYYTDLTTINFGRGYSCGLELMNPYNDIFVGGDDEMAVFIKNMENPRIKVTLKKGGAASSWNWDEELSFPSGKELALPDGYLDTGYFALFGNDDIITKVEIYDVGADAGKGQVATAPTTTTTEVPATTEPTTEAPSVVAPATDVPATDVPATNIPAVNAPEAVTSAPDSATGTTATPVVTSQPTTYRVNIDDDDYTKVKKPGRVKIKKIKSTGKGKVKVSWKGKCNDRYEIQYSTKKNFSGKKTEKCYSKSTTLYLKSHKKYYVRVRAVNYGHVSAYRWGYKKGKWSKVKSVRVK